MITHCPKCGYILCTDFQWQGVKMVEFKYCPKCDAGKTLEEMNKGAKNE